MARPLTGLVFGFQMRLEFQSHRTVRLPPLEEPHDPPDPAPAGEVAGEVRGDPCTARRPLQEGLDETPAPTLLPSPDEDSGCSGGSPVSPVTPLGHARPYVMFSSSASGKPRGVVGSLRATMHRLVWQWKTYPFDEEP